MPIFKCEECGCKENTALGWYWRTCDAGPEYDRKLCSQHAPIHFVDGTPTGHDGKWHGKFEQRKTEEE